MADILKTTSLQTYMDTEKLWENISHFWTMMIRGGDGARKDVIYPAILNLMGEISGLQMLDIGCGEGQFCRILAKRRANIIGLDISPSMIEYAKSYDSKETATIQYSAINAENLSIIPRKSIDVITMIMSLMCINNARKVLYECKKTLKKNGRLFIAILHPCFINAIKPTPLNIMDKKKDIDSYFNQQVYYMDLFDSPEIPIFHRSLSNYTQWLAESDFYIRRVVELPHSVDLQDDELKKYPSYLIFECIKHIS